MTNRYVGLDRRMMAGAQAEGNQQNEQIISHNGDA